MRCWKAFADRQPSKAEGRKQQQDFGSFELSWYQIFVTSGARESQTFNRLQQPGSASYSPPAAVDDLVQTASLQKVLMGSGIGYRKHIVT